MYYLMISYLKNNLEEEIIQTSKDNPQVEYTAKLDCVEDIYGDQKCVFKVVKSSGSGKIKDLLKVEEKLRIESEEGNIYIGTLIDIVENEIHVLLYKPVQIGQYKITRLINFNNYILRDELAKISMGKNMQKFVVLWFCDCILRKIEALIALITLEKINDNMIVLYIFLLSYTKDINKDICINNVLKESTKEKDKNLLNLLKETDINKKDTMKKAVQTINDVYNMYDKLNIQDIEDNLDAEFLNLRIEENNNISFFNDNLNSSQKLAVNGIFRSSSYKIIGPPGTGKTSTIIEIISQLLKKRNKILVCGPSNTSIDNIIEKFIVSKWYLSKSTKFYRRGSSFKGLTTFNLEYIVEKMTQFVKKERSDKNFRRTLKRIQEKYKKDIQYETSLVFATTFSSRKELHHFDWVIVDEACQVSSVECFLALAHAQNVILVGDPNQLCPKAKSLYEIVDMKTYFLNEQYRMCDRLMSFSNETFYSNRIKSFIKLSYNIIENSPLVFIDTKSSNCHESVVKKSKANLGEVDIVVKIVSYIKSNDIGIISPYSSQVLLIKEKLPSFEVATVDGFQGREKEFIIISLVRSNVDGNFGFLDDFKRLNVAITRCKKGLILVGNSDNFRKCGVFNKFFKHIEKKFISIDPLEIEEYFENIN